MHVQKDRDLFAAEVPMKCGKCQHENRAGAKFCEECASPLARACANCGAPLSPTAKFCSECAHPAGQAAMASPRPAAATEAHTPKHLAEKILTSKAALEGERKEVTVLFADLKGSLELLADRDPEEARQIIDPVLGHMIESVHRYEGTVNSVMGDGIMALFGAPLAHEDHAVRACYAALRMQESIKRYAEGVRRTEGIPIQIRVGLNSGEVVVCSIGSDFRMEYTAVGQTTHLAARMEQMAMPGTILITPGTLYLAEGYVTVQPLGPMSVKGLPEPVEVFQLTGAQAVRSRLQAAAVRGLTRFVGRDSEMDLLQQSLAQGRAGHGQIVAVVGEAGVGKSRLFWEFTHSHHTSGCLTVESSSVSYGKATAFLPLIDLLRGYFQIDARDDARKVREKVTGRLFSLDRALEPSLPPLLWLLGVPIDDPAWQQLDPLHRRHRTLDAVKRLLIRESQVQPLVVLFEDLHWVDAETQALLDSLVDSLTGARILLLVNYRPEYGHAWSGRTYYRHIRLDPLPPASTEVLLEAMLGTDQGLDALKRLLVARTEGNPFFLEECVRTLIETKVLVGERGDYRVAATPAAFEIPASAKAILAARIDRLSTEDKHVLQAASVIGKDVPFALLEEILDGGGDALRPGLNRLQAAEFLHEARLFPDLEYTFKHALTHDVAYNGLVLQVRRRLHARVVEAIEQRQQDRLGDEVERLAYHAVHGEIWDKAVRYLRQAGLRAMARAANREAAAHLEQALGALAHLPEGRETTELAVDLHFDVRSALIPLAEWQRMHEHLAAAEQLARALGDERRLARVSIYMVIQAIIAQDYREALRFGQEALAIGEKLQDLLIQAPANAYLGTACVSRGEYAEAVEYLQRNVAQLTGELRFERFGQATMMASFSRSILALALADLGRFDEAIVHAEEAARIAEEGGQHRYSLSFAWHALGWAHASRGDLADAAPVLARCVELCRASEFHVLKRVAMAALACVLGEQGLANEALALATEAAARPSPTFLAEYTLVSAGRAYLGARGLDRADECARDALDASRRHGARACEAWALHLMGQLAERSETAEALTARNWYRQALALAQELGMTPLVAHCHLGLGRVYRRAGDGLASEHLTTATSMYQSMGMRAHIEQADAALAA
jgi:class 3 adenylate cyclase/tetratricopeptide (TPR) repeat protein